MKRKVFSIALVALLILSLFGIPCFSAQADASFFLKVESDSVSLYENTAVQAAMFTLPRTFYVKVVRLSYTSSYHLVEYNGVRGLVKTSDFSSPPEENVPNPYYTGTNVTAHVNTYLYFAPSFSSRSEIEASGLSLTYLGKVSGEKGSYDTSVWFAVLYANEVYYLHCSLTNNLSLLESSFRPVHPNSVEPASGNPTTEKTDEAESGASFDVVRLLLILGMIVPLVVIVFLLFKPKRKRRSTKRRNNYDSYYPDEDDYDDYYDN